MTTTATKLKEQLGQTAMAFVKKELPALANFTLLDFEGDTKLMKRKDKSAHGYGWGTNKYGVLVIEGDIPGASVSTIQSFLMSLDEMVKDAGCYWLLGFAGRVVKDGAKISMIAVDTFGEGTIEKKMSASIFHKIEKALDEGSAVKINLKLYVDIFSA